MLYVESPAGVGFSYSNTSSDYITTDTKTCLNIVCFFFLLWTCFDKYSRFVAADNYAFLQGFFAKFPDFRNNDFYVSGESYAGLYHFICSLQDIWILILCEFSEIYLVLQFIL
jgi:serine carboxypeptidase-like clade 2